MHHPKRDDSRIDHREAPIAVGSAQCSSTISNIVVQRHSSKPQPIQRSVCFVQLLQTAGVNQRLSSGYVQDHNPISGETTTDSGPVKRVPRVEHRYRNIRVNNNGHRS